MATEQTTQPTHLLAEAPHPDAPAIENELPTYRAISRSAIMSVLCGVLASFTFADWFFLIFAILAVLFAVRANFVIKRHPDMFTGRGLANAGAAMGLIFGLTVTTYSAIHNFALSRSAESFGKEYGDALAKQTLGDALWYGMRPEMRKEKNAQQALKDFESVKTKEKMMMEMKLGPLLSLKKRLSSSQQEHLHFIDIEDDGSDESRQGEIGYYALALYEVEGPGTKDFPEKTQYALAIFKGNSHKGHYEWWVDDVKFPYQPKSYRPTPQPVDDGHGHAH